MYYKYKLDGSPISEQELIKWAEDYAGKDVKDVQTAIQIMVEYGHQILSKPIINQK